MTRKRLSALIASATLALLVLAPSADAAEFGVAHFDGSLDADPASCADPANCPYTAAGGHPYSASWRIELNTRENPDVEPHEGWPAEPVKDIITELPPGLVGSVAGLPRCTVEQLAGNDVLFNRQPLCPTGSQVGRIVVRGNGIAVPGQPGGYPLPLPTPAVFVMEPPPGTPARLGFQAFGTLIVLDASLRSDGDYGLSTTSANIAESLALTGVNLTLWGVPADPSHDAERKCPDQGFLGCASDQAPKPFLRLPTACTAPGEGLTSYLHADSWFNQGVFKTGSFVSHLPPGLLADPPQFDPSTWGAPQGPSDCAAVPFDPAISAQPTVHSADSPTGLEVSLSVPQDSWEQPGAISQSDLRKAVVTLPQGISVNPSSADGLGACSAEEIGLLGTGFPAPNPIRFDQSDPSCPNSSKIGTVRLQTPLLDEELQGAIYLARQSDNPFGSLLALYIVVKGSGTILKLPGKVIADPKTGRLQTVFDNNPQLPFSSLRVSLFGGPRASLRTPPRCGTYTTESQLTPWSGNAAASPSDSFQISSGPGGGACPGGAFDPKLSAGSANPLAGAFSPFVFRLTREDASQELAGLSATLPPGLVAKLAGIPYCPDAALAAIPTGDASLGLGAAQLAAPGCPAASQLGTVSAGAGAGANPFYLDTGRAYLAGPYKGAPLSMAILTPVLAGPFDLGNVLVRTALQVDPETARITAVSDPIPTILHGIPLDLRDLRVNIDRPNFTLNPTSCDPMAVAGTVTGSEGASAAVSDRFQVGNCARLAFAPKLSLSLSGPTHRSANPRLRATLKMPTGGANIARAQVTLPKTEILDQAHIRTICTRVQYAAEQCPKGAIYGYAKAWSPLLDQPLQGPVYLRSSSHELPDLVASLDGQIHVDLAGRIDSVNARIRNTFEAVPDAPVSKFILTMQGGKKGLLVNNTELCKVKPRASVKFNGQNGKIHDFRALAKADCGRQGKRGKK